MSDYREKDGEIAEQDEQQEARDPLAELARLVSAGSVFGSTAQSLDAEGASRNAYLPTAQAGPVEPFEPVAKEPAVDANQFVEAAIGETSQLVKEPIQSEPVLNDIETMLASELEAELTDVAAPTRTEIEADDQAVEEPVQRSADDIASPEFVNESATSDFSPERVVPEEVFEPFPQAAAPDDEVDHLSDVEHDVGPLPVASEPEPVEVATSIDAVSVHEAPDFDMAAQLEAELVNELQLDEVGPVSPVATPVESAEEDELEDLDPIASFIQEEIAKANSDLAELGYDASEYAQNDRSETDISIEAFEDAEDVEPTPVTSEEEIVPEAQAFEAEPLETVQASGMSAVEEALNIETFGAELDFTDIETTQVGSEGRAPNLDQFESNLAPTSDDTVVPLMRPEPVVATQVTPRLGVVDGGLNANRNDFDLGDEQFANDEHFDDFTAGEETFEPEEEKTARSKKIYALIAAGVAFIAIAGTVFFFVGGGEDEPVIVAADDTPVRVRPEEPGGRVIPNQDNVAYDQLAGDGNTGLSENGPLSQPDTSPDQIVGTSESPRVILPGPSGSPDVALVPETTVPSEAVSATRPQPGPRTVRTVVIRPDGTPIFSEPEAASGISDETVPVDTTVVAEPVPLRPATEPLEDRVAVSTQAAPVEIPTPQVAVPRIIEAAPEIVTAQPQTAAELPPLPRPNTDRNAVSAQPAVVATQTQEAPVAEPVAQVPQTQQASTGPAVGSGSFMVQLSSQRTEAQARTTFDTLQSRFAILSGYQADIRQADLGERGIFHRVRIGPFSRAEASGLCNQLKDAGGDCIVAVN